MVRFGIPVPKLVILLVAAAGWAGAEDPREIVRRSVSLDDRNEKLARNYTFLERSEVRQLDPQGGLRSRKSRTWDVTLLEGSPYRRLLERDDQPLSPDEEKKEQEKLAKSIQERKKESEAQGRKRLADYEQRRERERAFLREIPDAFDFRLVGEENLEGREMYVIEATPRAGYRPRLNRAKILSKFQGKLWIDKSEYQWAKVEAEVIDTVSFGLFIARLGKGSHLAVEQTRINDEVWLPRRVHAKFNARLALLKKYLGEVEVSYKNYRKFQADSRIVPATEVRPD